MDEKSIANFDHLRQNGYGQRLCSRESRTESRGSRWGALVLTEGITMLKCKPENNIHASQPIYPLFYWFYSFPGQRNSCLIDCGVALCTDGPEKADGENQSRNVTLGDWKDILWGSRLPGNSSCDCFGLPSSTSGVYMRNKVGERSHWRSPIWSITYASCCSFPRKTRGLEIDLSDEPLPDTDFHLNNKKLF